MRFSVVEVLATALLLGGLALLSSRSGSFFVSSFPEIWSAFHRIYLFDQFADQVVPTLRRIVIGFASATAAGLALGFILGSSRLVREVTDPLFAFARAVPLVTLIPVFIILIGIDDNMKITIVTLAGMWPVALNVIDGLLELDSTKQDTVRAFRLTRSERLRWMTFPSVLPRAFAGMQATLAFSLIGVIVSEYLVGTEGLGFMLSQAQQTLDIPAMWATIVMIGLIGFLVNSSFVLVRRRVLFWVPALAAVGREA